MSVNTFKFNVECIDQNTVQINYIRQFFKKEKSSCIKHKSSTSCQLEHISIVCAIPCTHFIGHKLIKSRYNKIRSTIMITLQSFAKFIQSPHQIITYNFYDDTETILNIPLLYSNIHNNDRLLIGWYLDMMWSMSNLPYLIIPYNITVDHFR